MSRGNANTKPMRFTAKVLNPKTGNYEPIYTPPEATSGNSGVVWLSDAIDSKDAAASSAVAATPKAVSDVKAVADNKLDRTTPEAQTVAGPVTFTSGITTNGALTGDVVGNVSGNATTATTLQNGRRITITHAGESASEVFNGSKDITINLGGSIDATKLKGMIPLASIPASAQERVVTVSSQTAQYALTKDNVQNGDTVYRSDENKMYMVVDDSRLTSASGYQEYSAGTASKLGSATVGGTSKIFYLNDGAPALATGTIGAANKAVYINGGTITAVAHTVDKDVPSDALFTDHQYSTMKGATTSAAGTSGLVPAPASGANNLFLRGDGTWQEAGKVKGVKGDSETAYRTGEVSLSPANIGALATTGGTLTGTVTTRAIAPSADTQYDLGTSSARWRNVEADNINLDTATFENGAFILSGRVVMPSGGNANIVYILGSKDDESKIPSVSTVIDKEQITGTMIAKNTIKNNNLADEVGTVYVGSDEPTENHVKLWVKVS